MVRTVGVEEEFLLLRPGSTSLAAVGDEVVAEAAQRSQGQFEHELKREQAELATAPHESAAALAEELLRRRHELAAGARARGVRLAALATSPSDEHTSATSNGRYERMMQLYGHLARLQLTCGLHLHVSVSSREEGVAVVDRIRPWLAVLLALSGNSPYHHGEDTGYASYRTILWGQWPTAGVTEPFRDVATYERVTQGVIDSGAALDPGMLYFDARLSERYPTVEIRVADVCLESTDAATLAMLARALVDTAAEEWRRGSGPAPHRTELLRAATWRAARWGTEERLLDPSTGCPGDAWEVVHRLVDLVEPALAVAGDTERVSEGLDLIRHRGTGARLQRQAFAAGRFDALVDMAVRRTVGEDMVARDTAAGDRARRTS